MRNFDLHPYSEDEARVAKFFADFGVGGGDDPIGFLIASHMALTIEREELSREIRRIQTGHARRLLNSFKAKYPWGQP